MNLYQGLVAFGPTLVFQIANTIIIFLLLKKFLFKPVKDMLDKRKAFIEKNIEDSKTEKEQAEALKLEYERKIEEIRAEAEEIIKDAKAKAEEKSREIIAEAREKTEVMFARAENEIKEQSKKAYYDLKDDVASLAVMAAEKIIGEKMDDSLNDKLLHQFIEEAGDVKWQN